MRLPTALASALVIVAALAPITVYAEEGPAPSQALESDPQPAPPSYGLSADGAAIVFGDYAARFDGLVLPMLSLGVTLGVSQRAQRDDLLVEVLATLWFLGEGLEGPFLSALAGVSASGAWADPGGATGRLGGEAGWQLLWDSLAISIGAGCHAALEEGREVAPELRIRGALGVVF